MLRSERRYPSSPTEMPVPTCMPSPTSPIDSFHSSNDGNDDDAKPDTKPNTTKPAQKKKHKGSEPDTKPNTTKPAQKKKHKTTIEGLGARLRSQESIKKGIRKITLCRVCSTTGRHSYRDVINVGTIILCTIWEPEPFEPFILASRGKREV